MSFTENKERDANLGNPANLGDGLALNQSNSHTSVMHSVIPTFEK